MHEANASRTAMRVAAVRAAHQVLDAPLVLDDPVALRLVGLTEAAVRGTPRFHTWRARRLRAFLVARSRFAEDALAAAVARGVTQYVVLGAGLDTFAYRNPFPPDRLRVFEVDHPATQAWKRKRLADVSIAIPGSLTFAPVDFERMSLLDGLKAAGFDPSRATFFSWLGVTMYLTRDAIGSTLADIARTGAGGGLAFDYGVKPKPFDVVSIVAGWLLRRRVASVGEPFRTLFTPAELRALLAKHGFHSVEEIGPAEVNARYFAGRSDDFRMAGRLGRLAAAQT